MVCNDTWVDGTWQFGWWMEISMGTLTGLQLCNKLWCSVYSDSFLSESTNFFSSFSYSSSSVRLDHWGQSAFAVHQRGLPAHDPVTGSPLFLSCPLGPRSKPAAWKWYAFLDNMNTILRKSLRFDWAWCFLKTLNVRRRILNSVLDLIGSVERS